MLTRMVCFGVVVALAVSAFVLGGCGSDTVEAVEFADANLEAAVREAIGLPEGDIQGEDLREMTVLRAENAGIRDLEGLQHCSNLSRLDLTGNGITDVEILGGLRRLKWLHLDENDISDISPLLTLVNLDDLYLRGNPLDQSATEEHIPVLEERGVHVELSYDNDN